MFKFDIREISKEDALKMIQKYHYSNTLPKINKYFLGFYLDEELVGVVTLGWGTRPRHTIQRIFPSLDTKDYLEIGRMCMAEEMPRNSESQMLSQLVKWIHRNLPELKILFTWADGMVGKVGYVYQASNFIYAGYSDGEMYMKDKESEDAIMQEKNELEKYESKMSRKERQAMERFANFMVEMILKYGPKVLAEIEAEEERKKEE